MTMIDGNSYRLAKTAAMRQLPHWEMLFIHLLCFEESNSAFPTRIDSIQDLYPILDTMQETRYDAYMHELNGVTEDELSQLVQILRDYVKMHLLYFPIRRIKMPLSTIISYFVTYKKLCRFNKNFGTILEVGPGCGALCYYLRNHAPLRDYSFVEASEAYYIMQSMVATHCFGEFFEERAFPEIQQNTLKPFTTQINFETDYFVDFEVPKKARHFPWWRLGEIADKRDYFEVIVSNANLQEMGIKALHDYLTVYQRALKKDGILLAQCLGGPIYRSERELFDIMIDKGFGMLAHTNGTVKIATPGGGQFDCNTAVRNGIFVKDGHPLFAEGRQRITSGEMGISRDPVISNMFCPTNGARRMVPARELISIVVSSEHERFRQAIS